MLFGGSTKGLKFNQRGLIPAIVQDAETLQVLIYVYMNKDAIKQTQKTRDLWLYHRSMKKVWRKGSHSGHTMKVVDMLLHHDRNILLIKVIPAGPACHTGNDSCFIHPYLTPEKKLPEYTPTEVEGDNGLDMLRKLFDSQELRDEVEIVPKQSQSEKIGQESGLSIELEEREEASPGDTLEEIFARVRNKISRKEGVSVTARLAALGSEKIAQKIGENALQLLVSVTRKDQDGLVKREAEMMHHLLILLAQQELEIKQLEGELRKRLH